MQGVYRQYLYKCTIDKTDKNKTDYKDVKISLYNS